MKRIEDGWFSLDGIKCDDVGLRLLEMPKRRKAKMRGDFLTASGRDGDVWKSDDAYEAYDISIKCESADNYDENNVRAWLDGKRELVFSDEPGLVYDTTIREYVDFASKYQRFDTKLVTFVAHVQPFRRILPAADPITLTASGFINNPGTAYSLPKITVRGNGDFSLTINTQTMFFNDVDDGIVLDSELVDAFNLEESLLCNSNVSGEFFRLQPGMNLISWVPEDGSNVESVTIEPRWRCI